MCYMSCSSLSLTRNLIRCMIYFLKKHALKVYAVRHTAPCRAFTFRVKLFNNSSCSCTSLLWKSGRYFHSKRRVKTRPATLCHIAKDLNHQQHSWQKFTHCPKRLQPERFKQILFHSFYLPSQNSDTRLLTLSCPSARPQEKKKKTRLLLNGFPLNLISEVFPKICRGNSSFVKTRQV
jgi:hypothetical protein